MVYLGVIPFLIPCLSNLQGVFSLTWVLPSFRYLTKWGSCPLALGNGLMFNGSEGDSRYTIQPGRLPAIPLSF